MGPAFNDSKGTQQDTDTGTVGFLGGCWEGTRGSGNGTANRRQFVRGPSEQEEVRLGTAGTGAAF